MTERGTASGGWSAVSCGGEHSCGILSGAAQGTERIVVSSNPLVRALRFPTAEKVVCGAYHTVVMGGGRAWAWGEGVFRDGRDGCIPALGQKDRSSEATRPVPIDLVTSSNRRLVATDAKLGGYHTVLLCKDPDGGGDEVFTFGAAQLGQLGRHVGLGEGHADSTGLPVDGSARKVDLPDGCVPSTISNTRVRTRSLLDLSTQM